MELREIMKHFNLPGTYKGSHEIKVGHINSTYRVDYEQEGKRTAYILQKINTNVFHEPENMMENISRVTKHIASLRPDQPHLVFFQAVDGQLFFKDGEDYWRVCNFIPSVTYDEVTDLNLVEHAGFAFGEFQKMLGSFSADALHETIQNFHNTDSRFDDFERVVREDPVGAVASARDEIEWYLSVREKACTLHAMQVAGRLPLRVTHNDTKLNNILFTEEGATVIVDLDTVMPGLVGHDFGDAIRFAANTCAEDCRDIEQVHVNLDVFEAFTRGFVKAAGDILTQNEKDTLALSAFCLTVECGCRFLADYLAGNVYFRTAYPEHNLVRGRCQMALAKDMLIHMDEMEEIVRKL